MPYPAKIKNLPRLDRQLLELFASRGRNIAGYTTLVVAPPDPPAFDVRTGVRTTLRWREMDSNSRFRAR
jgi:hypothetical protein